MALQQQQQQLGGGAIPVVPSPTTSSDHVQMNFILPAQVRVQMAAMSQLGGPTDGLGGTGRGVGVGGNFGGAVGGAGGVSTAATVGSGSFGDGTGGGSGCGTPTSLNGASVKQRQQLLLQQHFRQQQQQQTPQQQQAQQQILMETRRKLNQKGLSQQINSATAAAGGGRKISVGSKSPGSAADPVLTFRQTTGLGASDQVPTSIPGLVSSHVNAAGVIGDVNATTRARRGEVGPAAIGSDRDGSSKVSHLGAAAGGGGAGVGGGLRVGHGVRAMSGFAVGGAAKGDHQGLLPRQQQRQKQSPSPLPADAGLSMAAAVASFYNEVPGRSSGRHLGLEGAAAGTAVAAGSVLGGVGAAGAGTLASPGLAGLDWQQSLQVRIDGVMVWCGGCFNALSDRCI